MNGIFLFVLAVAARRFDIRIHAYCVLSNHFHLVVTDPGARLPAFQQYLDALVARAVNASLGRWESFWAPSTFSAVALASAEDVVAKCAYVLANPVAAGLVESGRDWPGAWSAPERIGGEAMPVPRPTTFFSANGSMPESAPLELTAPLGFESTQHFRNLLTSAVAALEETARAAITREGRTFLGIARVLRQTPRSQPISREPRRNLDPRHAARNKWKRIEALSRLSEFLHAYREAWKALRARVEGVVFPAGTYALRVFHGVKCAPA